MQHAYESKEQKESTGGKMLCVCMYVGGLVFSSGAVVGAVLGPVYSH